MCKIAESKKKQQQQQQKHTIKNSSRPQKVLRGQWCQLYVNYLYREDVRICVCILFYHYVFLVLCYFYLVCANVYILYNVCWRIRTVPAYMCVWWIQGEEDEKTNENEKKKHNNTYIHTYVNTLPAKIDNIYMCLLACCSIGSYASFWCLSFLHSYVYDVFFWILFRIDEVFLKFLLLLLHSLLWLIFCCCFGFCQYVDEFSTFKTFC